jgi:hypothetical protein
MNENEFEIYEQQLRMNYQQPVRRLTSLQVAKMRARERENI